MRSQKDLPVTKNNKKRIQLDRKSRRNLVQNYSKLSIRPTLSPIIFGIEWDKDKLIFSVERGSQWD